ncbi:MAG: GNAT family N-acetyltransferase [Porticoccaceae bacterium]
MSDFQASTGSFGRRGQTVTHYPERHCFLSRLGDSEAVLDYELTANSGINFHHTYVPEALRGQGIAETLVRTGLAWARQEGMRIEASCWYVQRFLRA